MTDWIVLQKTLNKHGCPIVRLHCQTVAGGRKGLIELNAEEGCAQSVDN